MAVIRAIGFLRVIEATPAWMATLTVAVGAYGAIVIWLDPESVDNALGTLLLWQMLAASRGFVGPASSGYFDPVLQSVGRKALAIAHAVHASAPVVAVWIVLGLLEFARGVDEPAAFDPGRLSALVFVSLTAWALSLPSPRLITGSLWLAVLALTATTRFGLEQYAAMLSRGDGIVQTIQAAAFVLVCPFLMLEPVMPSRTGLALTLAGASILSGWAGLAFVVRRDYPLEPAR